MAKLKDFIIDLEQQGNIYYDDEQRRYYLNRKGRATRRCKAKDESRISSKEYTRGDDLDGGWRKLFHQD